MNPVVIGGRKLVRLPDRNPGDPEGALFMEPSAIRSFYDSDRKRTIKGGWFKRARTERILGCHIDSFDKDLDFFLDGVTAEEVAAILNAFTEAE